MKKTALISFIILLIVSLCSCGGEQAKEVSGDVCYVTIDCHNALSAASLSPDKKELQPEDGIILNKAAVPVTEGMTAMDAFEKACKDAKLQFEYGTFSSMKYVDGVNNLYSKDCGDLSGWFFFYNGESPSVGMENLKVEKDAQILIIYSCDMGADAGATM